MTHPSMRWSLGTIGDPDAPRTVLVADGKARYLCDALGVCEGRPEEVTVLQILRQWERWTPRLRAAAGVLDQIDVIPPDAITWLPPVLYPDKLLCVGANYNAHNKEMGIDVEQIHPFVFLKPPSTSLVAHRAPIGTPPQVHWLDWEGELALVIGRELHAGRGPEVLDAVAGYTALNDVSARDWAEQLIPGLGQDWFLHKAFDGFTPIGPTITPAWMVPDPQDLLIQVSVNGVVKQEASTSGMVFSIIAILEHLSSVTTLRPGDIVATGSPPGVGFGRHPREHLSPGDEVVVRIGGLDELANPVGVVDPQSAPAAATR